MNSEHKGQLACLKVEMRAAERGVIVSKPTIQARYDYILDWDGRLYRIQVKYAVRSPSKCSGAVFVELRKGNRTYLDHEVDAVLVYAPQFDTVYWLGPEIFHGKQGIHIRFEDAKNGQQSGCIRAQEHIW